MASLMNNGQACMIGTRILAPRSRYGQIVEALAAMTNSLRVGDAMEQSTQIGPMASSAHRDRVEGYIAKGKAEARLVSGGGRPKNVSGGWFGQPRVLRGVPNSATL